MSVKSEYMREYMREYRKKHPDSGKIAAKLWRERHPERKIDSNKKFIAKNPDYHKKWYEKNRMDSVIRHGDTRAKILALYNTGTKKIREISETIGCSYETVRKHLRASGK